MAVWIDSHLNSVSLGDVSTLANASESAVIDFITLGEASALVTVTHSYLKPI